MKFQNEQNEFFWENISKFDLSGETFRVLCAWVIDVPETHAKRFFPAISIIMQRTGIKHKQQVSRAYKDLVERGILEEIETKGSTQAYKLNPDLLKKGYQPPDFEPVELNVDEESPEQIEYENSVVPPALNPGIGKKDAGQNQKETVAPKSSLNRWIHFMSPSQQQELWAKCEIVSYGFKITFSRSKNPKEGFTSVAPAEVVEDFCREVLKIELPEQMLEYIDPRDRDRFKDKHKIR